MLVDLVLAVDGQYWRMRRELAALPDIGTVVQVLDDAEIEATVTGSTRSATGDEDGTAVAAVLVRASTTLQGGVGAGLRRAGWHQLL